MPHVLIVPNLPRGWRGLLACILAIVFVITFAHTEGIEPLITSIAISEGSISVAMYGQESAPVILLLHGLFAQKEQWTGLAKLMADRGYRVIAPDLPGYGASAGYPVSAYALEHQAALVASLLDELGIRRIHLAGNSMGGAIALMLASTWMGQVESLAFIGSPLGVIPMSDGVRAALRSGTNPFIPLNRDEVDLEMSLLFARPPVLPDTAKDTLVAMYTASERHYRQVWDIVGLYARLFSELQIPAIPILALWGDADRIYPIAGLSQLTLLDPKVTAIQIPDAGHLPHLENPGPIAELYTEFLSP